MLPEEVGRTRRCAFYLGKQFRGFDDGVSDLDFPSGGVLTLSGGGIEFPEGSLETLDRTVELLPEFQLLFAAGDAFLDLLLLGRFLPKPDQFLILRDEDRYLGCFESGRSSE